jgi:hypothetical protein
MSAFFRRVLNKSYKNASVTFVIYVCPHITTRELLNEFSGNLLLRSFTLHYHLLTNRLHSDGSKETKFIFIQIPFDGCLLGYCTM